MSQSQKGVVRAVGLEQTGRTVIEIESDDGHILSAPVSTPDFNSHVCLIRPKDVVYFEQRPHAIIVRYPPNAAPEVQLPETEISVVYLVKADYYFAYRKTCRCPIYIDRRSYPELGRYDEIQHTVQKINGKAQASDITVLKKGKVWSNKWNRQEE